MTQDELISELLSLPERAGHASLRNSGLPAYNQSAGDRRESSCEFLAVPAALTWRSGVTSAHERRGG